MKKLLCASLCLGLCLSAGMLRAQTEDPSITATARKTLETYSKAVIVLDAVIKIEIRGQEQELKAQCVATIIDPSGLAVTAMMNLNPISSLRGPGGRPIPSSEVDSQVQEVKYRLTDGTEVPARLVLKDEDLDLAFLAPLKPLDKPTQAKIASISLSDAAKAAELLDTTIFINRTNDELNYLPVLGLGRIVALVSTPKTCYLTNAGVPGLFIFDREGRPLGIVCRCINSEASQQMLSRLISPSTSPIILPTADVVKLMPQVKEEVKKAAAADLKAEEAKKKAGDKKAKDSKEPKKDEASKKDKKAENEAAPNGEGI